MKKLLLLLILLFVPAIVNGQTISGTTCPGTGCADVNVNSNGSLGIQITGTWSGTVTFRGSVGNTSSSIFTDLVVFPLNTQSSTTTATANGIWTVGVAGLGRVRVVLTSYSSGSAVITFRTLSAARSNFAAEITADVTVGDITVVSSALPTGASTSAKQDSQTALLTTLSGPIGSAIGGAQGASSQLGGCIYNAVPPALTSGQQIGFQCDSAGNMKISAEIALSGDVTVSASALPTGASTSANQSTQITRADTQITSLQLLDDTVGSKAAGTAATSATLTGAVYNTATPTLTNGQQIALQTDVNGNLRTTASVSIGTVTGTSTSGCYLVSAASNNATNCKASAASFYGIRLINTTDTIYYLRMYNLASAPTCSSATGFIESIPVPASTSGNGVVWSTSNPIAYSTGIGFCFTSGSASTNNGSAATGVFGAILYN